MKRGRRPPGPPARRRTGGRRLAWPIVVVLVLAGAGWWVAGRKSAPPPPAAPPPIAGRIEDIYSRARLLLAQKRPADALPLLRHAVRARPDLWQIHQSYAVALLNTSYDSRLHRGFPASVTRSSIERVAAASEAVSELETAQRMAVTPRERAGAQRLRAQLMGAWGFPWDAFILYRQAHTVDPSWDEPAMLGDQMMLLMRFPGRAIRTTAADSAAAPP